MARQVIWSKRSLELLKEILDYWTERNGTVTYSEKLYSLLQIALVQLAKYPDTGRLTENITIRYKKVRTYYIYYSFGDNILKIIAVSHVKRKPEYLKSLID